MEKDLIKVFNEKDWERIKAKTENRNEIFKKIIKHLDPKIMEKVKDFFESNVLDGNQKITLQVVLDASILNRHIRAYIKHDHSFLLDLLESPFFNGIAPIKLKNEINKHIADIAIYCKRDVKEIEIIATKFLSKVTYQNLDDDIAYQKAADMIAKRDKDDVDYVALYLKLGKHAIISTDKDILDLEEVNSWRSTKEACEIINIYQQGSASFVVLATSIPLLGLILFELGILIIGGLLAFIIALIDKIIKIIKTGYDFISILPNEWKIILGILFVTLLIWEDSRELIFKAIKKSIQNYIKRIKEIIDFMKPYFVIAGKWCSEEFIVNSTILLENISLTINQLNQLENQLTLEESEYIHRKEEK
ncbi:MAG: PIN domain-containing protein [Candidatus Heimdallarchaeota archaeon]